MLVKTAHYKYRYSKGPHRFSQASEPNLKYPYCYLHLGGFSINGTKRRFCSFYWRHLRSSQTLEMFMWKQLTIN